jgi:hypothetical protein
MQQMVENQRVMAEAMRQLIGRDARQGQDPNHNGIFKAFMDTKPPIFKEAVEPLQADE